MLELIIYGFLSLSLGNEVMNLPHRPDDTRDRDCILNGFKESVHEMFDFVIKVVHLGYSILYNYYFWGGNNTLLGISILPISTGGHLVSLDSHL